MATKGRPKGSKNKLKTPFPAPKGAKVTFNQLNKDAEQDIESFNERGEK